MPSQFGRLHQLEGLHLSNNNLKYLPASLKCVSQLQLVRGRVICDRNNTPQHYSTELIHINFIYLLYTYFIRCPLTVEDNPLIQEDNKRQCDVVAPVVDRVASQMSLIELSACQIIRYDIPWHLHNLPFHVESKIYLLYQH